MDALGNPTPDDVVTADAAVASPAAALVTPAPVVDNSAKNVLGQSQGDDIDKYFAEQRKTDAAAGLIVLNSLVDDPNQVAGDISLATHYAALTGNPAPTPSMVKQFRPVFQQKIDDANNLSILSTAPRLTDWLRDPTNASIAKDDLPNLSWWETIGANLKEVPKGVPGAAVSYTGSVIEGGGQLLTPSEQTPEQRDQIEQIANLFGAPPERVQALRDSLVGNPHYADLQRAISDAADGTLSPDEVRSTLQPIFGDVLKAVSPALQNAGQAVSDYGDTILPASPGMENSTGRTLGSGIGSMIPVIAATLLTGGGGGFALAGLGGSGEATQNARKAGATEEQQSEAAGLGILPGMLDAIPVEGLLSKSAGAGWKYVLLQIAKQAGVEGVQEGVQQVGQNAIAKEVYDPNKALIADVGENVFGGGLVGGVMEIAKLGLEALLPGHARAKIKAGHDNVAKADQSQQTLADISAQAQTSQVRARTPDKFREFVANAQAGTPVENIYVPAEKFTEYFQSLGFDPRNVIDELPGVTHDDLDAAIAGGGDLKIPTATYAANLAGGDHDQFFMDNFRFDPNDFTAAEAKVFNEKSEDITNEAYELAAAQFEADQESRSHEQEIYDTMVSRLRAAGRSTDVATTEATLYPAFYQTMAERSGMTTEEFMQRYPLPQVEGERPEGMQLKDVDALTRTLAEARKGRETKDNQPGLLDFIHEYGGINDTGGELKSRNATTVKRGKGKKTLKLARGVLSGARDLLGGGSAGKKHGVDDVARAAIEAGYLADDPIANEYRASLENGTQAPDISKPLYEAIDRELRGEKQVVGNPATDETNSIDKMEEYLSRLGVSLDDSDDTIRAALAVAEEEEGRKYGQAAYHGTPHLFDKFSTDHIGSGEGAQAFGWGMYFAGRKEIAEFYRDTLAKFVIDGNEMTIHELDIALAEAARAAAPGLTEADAGYIASNISSQIQDGESVPRLVENATRGDKRSDESKGWIAAGKIGEKATRAKGRLFEVEVPDDNELMVWEKPVKDQPDHVRSALLALGASDEATVQDFYTDLGQKLSPDGKLKDGDAAASKALRDAGIPGHRYLDAGSRGDGDGVYNYVIYDDSRVAVKSYEQSGDMRPRGLISIPAGGVGNGDTIINLFQSADLSTMVHESGHYFLTVMQNMAATGEQQASTDYAVVKDWWRANAAAVAKDAGSSIVADDVVLALDNGTTGDAVKDAAIDTGMQEQWARAFEHYLMEGKAPSIELRTAFEKMRSWLISVYRKLAGLRVNVSPEINGVFSRMLASDAAIAAAQNDTGETAPVFADAASMGLTQEQYDGFLKLREQAQDQAKSKLLAEIMQPIKRERDKAYKAEKSAVRAEVEREVNAFPYYRAIEAMGNGRWFGEEGFQPMPDDVRLSKQSLVDQYGEGVLDTLPRGSRAIYSVEGGLDPQEAADYFGFESADDMISALEKAPRRVEAIDAETARVMRERHGDVLTDGTVEAKALEAVHNDKRGQWIAAELKAVTDIAGSDRGLTAKEATHTARKAIARMKVRDAANAARFLAAERKAGAEAAHLGAMLSREKIWADAARRKIAGAAKAAVRGSGSVNAVAPVIDRANNSTGNHNETATKFIEAKRRQLINHALYSEALKVATEVEKAENLVSRLGKKSTREKIAGAGRRENAQVDYLAAIDEILDQYDFRKMSGAAEQRRGALLDYVAKMTAAGRDNELAIPDSVLTNAGRTPYKTIPVEELRGVVDTLKNIEHTARRWDKLIDAANERELDATVESIGAEFEKNMRQDRGAKGRNDREKKSVVRSLFNKSLTATTILRQIDGFEDQGTAYEAIKRPMDEATNRETERKIKATKDLEAVFSVYSNKEQRAMSVQHKVPGVRNAMSHFERLAVALNSGNKDNRARLVSPRVADAWSLTEAEVDTILASLDERDANFVQSVWDLIGSFKGDMAARERRVTGSEPAWVEAEPVTVGGKLLAGGYYPIKYDPASSINAGKRSEQDISDMLKGGGFTKAQTRNGHLKERGQGGEAAINLSLDVLPQHLTEVIHDLEMSEPITNAYRILNDKRVVKMFGDAGQSDALSVLNTWLLDVSSGPIRQADALSQAAGALKSSYTAAKLAFNVGTALLQTTAYLPASAAVGPKHWLTGAMEVFKNPAAAARDAAAKSVFMANRQTTFNKDINDFMQGEKRSAAATRYKEFKSGYGKLGFWMMQKSQWHFGDVPTWIAGYHQGLEKFDGDETKAIRHADDTVKRTQGSGLEIDKTALQRGSLNKATRQSAFIKILTTLGSYADTKFNMAFEINMNAARKIKSAATEEGLSAGDRAGQISQAAGLYAVQMAVAVLAEQFLQNAVKGALVQSTGGESGNDDDWLAYIGKTTGLSLLATVPWARTVGTVYQGFSGGGVGTAVSTDFVKASQTVGKVLTGNDLKQSDFAAITNLIGDFTGLPSAQMNRIVGAANRQSQGQKVSPIEYLMSKPH